MVEEQKCSDCGYEYRCQCGRTPGCTCVMDEDEITDVDSNCPTHGEPRIFDQMYSWTCANGHAGNLGVTVWCGWCGVAKRVGEHE